METILRSSVAVAIFLLLIFTQSVTTYASVGADLVVSLMTNNTSSSANGGTQFNWQATIVNSGSSSAIFSSGDTVFTNDLPAVTSIDSININYGVGNSTGSISCTLADPVVCTADTGGFTLFGSSGSFTVQITVTAPLVNAILTNPDGDCSVDPLDVISEEIELNNDCPSDPVTISTADIVVHKENTIGTGNAKLGVPFIWAIDIENIGNLAAQFNDGEIIFQDQLPVGADYVPVGPTGAAVTRAQNGASATIDCVVDLNLLFTCTLTSGGPLTLISSVVIPIGGVEVTPTIVSGTLVNPTGGICRVDPNNEIVEVNDEVNGTNNNDCNDSVIVQTSFEKLPTTESIRTVATYNSSFWCGERKEEFSMDGNDFLNVEQYETEIEIVYPQKRILGVFPLPQAEAVLVESATLTEPSNFQTPGAMTVPVKNSIRVGKTLLINCEDLLEHPTSLDEIGDIDQLLTQVLADEDYFHGVMTIDSSVSDVRVFVTKIVRSWKGVDQGSGLEVLESQLDRDRYEVEGINSSNQFDVNFSVPVNVLALAAMSSQLDPGTDPSLSDRAKPVTLQKRHNSIVFHSQSAITHSITVEIFGLNGQKIYSDQTHGNSLVWNMRNEAGHRVANGVYFAQITLYNAAGDVIGSQLKKLAVLR